MHTKPKKRFYIVVEAMPGVDDEWAYMGLKRLLKSAKRAYQLRCIDAQELHPNGPQDAPKAGSGQKGGR